jgi:hypothetical protein
MGYIENIDDAIAGEINNGKVISKEDHEAKDLQELVDVVYEIAGLKPSTAEQELRSTPFRSGTKKDKVVGN